MEFYESGLSDIWDSYYMQDTNLIQDLLASQREDEWNSILLGKDNKTTLSVVLKDRLMTDAALGGPRPIKTEHNYSMLASSSPASPIILENNQHTPNLISSSVQNQIIHTKQTNEAKPIGLQTRIDDMEEECFPAISMNTASGCVSSSSKVDNSASSSSSSSSSLSSSTTTTLEDMSKNNSIIAEELAEFIIKGEPISEPNSPEPSCESTNLTEDDKNNIAMISPHSIHFNDASHASDSEEDDEEYYQNMEIEFEAQNNEITTNRRESRQGLPPTPPSSASSDSEGPSLSCSPEHRNILQNPTHVHNIRGYLNPRLYVTTTGHSARQPIHTSLISCQPKGSTGSLVLTDEEKRTLTAEGYPIPTKMPLTKQEEKFLKKVRRKIKNKISAQESRRKKKEYMDGLERRVTMLTNENSSYKHRLMTLEDLNSDLLKELKRLQSMIDPQSS